MSESPIEAEVAPRSRRPKSRRVDLRASDHQARVIRQAADATDRSMTDFILDTATEAAERVLADRRWFAVDDAQWKAFLAALDAPLPSTDRFERLARRPSPFAATSE
jgi:uncharacterized protein (DUF1778 family)